MFEKGFLAVNGASLTIAALDRVTGQFSINFIPETLARTNLSLLQQGDLVNIEVDSQTRVIVETVERIMAERASTAEKCVIEVCCGAGDKNAAQACRD